MLFYHAVFGFFLMLKSYNFGKIEVIRLLKFGPNFSDIEHFNYAIYASKIIFSLGIFSEKKKYIFIAIYKISQSLTQRILIF